MRLSIITPCSRPYNLPTIYKSILDLKTDNVEWIVVFDGESVDKRILMYEQNIPIKLYNKVREIGDPMGGMLRNIGIEHADGDYLYYLDDDNIIHPKLYDRICRYMDYNYSKLIIFNQYSSKFTRRINTLNINCIRNGYLDTAQFVVPKKCKTRWIKNVKRFEEIPYILNIIDEIGVDNVIWVDRLYTYRNYLRR